MIQHSDILEESVKGTRKRSGKSFEVLYLLTYKQSYLDVRFSEPRATVIRKVLTRAYTKVWNRADSIPGGILLHSWIRDMIAEAYRDVTNEELDMFPDDSYQRIKGSLEPMRTEILLKVEENVGMFNPDEDDEDDLRSGIRASEEEIYKKTGAARLGRIRAVASLLIAVALVIIATLAVMDMKDAVGRTERINIGDLSRVIATAESTESETLTPPKK